MLVVETYETLMPQPYHGQELFFFLFNMKNRDQMQLMLHLSHIDFENLVITSKIIY